jgi:flagellar basal body L-ring protein FlgH
MRRVINLTLFIAIATLASCSSYVDRMYREFDRADGRAAPQAQRDKFDLYRKGAAQQRMGTVSSRNVPNFAPQVKRQYSASANGAAPGRTRANDLNDNNSDGSLWAGQNQGNSNYLFTQNQDKRNGDIVLINVFSRLKNEITAELKRAFPDPIRQAPKAAAGAAPQAAATPEPVASSNNDEAATGSEAHDRISTVVVEEINRDHILLRGRKNLLYKNMKRLVEIQALVSRRDVSVEDVVSSDTILESNITVLR